MKNLFKIALLLFAGAALAVLTAWGALAIYYSPLGETPRQALAAAFGLFGLSVLLWFLFARTRLRAAVLFLAVFGILVVWWLEIPASNHRDWAPEYAVQPYVTVEGERLAFHNIRNFDYRTERDFTPRYYDRTFDLEKLESVDMIATYWMGDAVAHIMMSFGFGGGDFLAVSIETRREKTEGYSTVAGFFKQYELFYVVADERDLVRLRTNYRKDPPEHVYIYRIRVADAEKARRFLMDYVREINELKDRPGWYNTLTTNCTTNIFMHAGVNPGRLPFHWKILASGYIPEYLYEHGRLDTSLPFEELRRRAYVNEAAQAAGGAPDFSRRIRAGVPVPKVD